jgi:hypothetical protein
VGVIHLQVLSIRSWGEVDVLESTGNVCQHPLRILLPSSLVCELHSYLECSSHAVHTIIRFFRTQPLERQLHRLILLRDQVVRSVATNAVSKFSTPPSELRLSSSVCIRPSVPQPELPVPSSVLVPLADGQHPPLQPWALDDEVGERRLRHLCGGGRGMSCRMALAMRWVFAGRELLRSKAKLGLAPLLPGSGLAMSFVPHLSERRSGSLKLPALLLSGLHFTDFADPSLACALTTAFLTDDSCSGRASRETLAANGVGALQIRTEPVLRGAEQRAYQIRGGSDDGTTT